MLQLLLTRTNQNKSELCRCGLSPGFVGALTLRPPTVLPLMTPTQTLGPQNLTTQKRFDHVTLSPKSGRIVRPTKIVTLQPQKVGRSVTVEHYDPF
jgi:hypothetical protein